MNFLDRNTLPKFQERLDLAASELNDAEDILTAAINELAGRLTVINNLIPEDQRAQYAQEVSYPVLNKIDSLQSQIDTLSTTISNIENSYDAQIAEINAFLADLDTRLNFLDDAAARKEDLNVILYRTGQDDTE